MKERGIRISKDKKLIPNKCPIKFKSAITKNEKIKPKDKDKKFKFLSLSLKNLLQTLFMYPAKLAHKEVTKNKHKSSFMFYFQKS